MGHQNPKRPLCLLYINKPEPGLSRFTLVIKEDATSPRVRVKDMGLKAADITSQVGLVENEIFIKMVLTQQ